MGHEWYEVEWPWIGFGGAIAILVLLFCTNFLKSNQNAAKWKDPEWLAWLCTAAYLIHNLEEYGIDIFGNLYAFPGCFQSIMVGSAAAMPDAFFMAINIPAFWVTFPLIAVCSKRHPWASPVLAAGLFTNAVSHTIPFLVGVGYTPGAFTAIVLFYPISIWAGVALFGKGKLPYRWMAVCIMVFLVGYAVLLGSAKLYISGMISEAALVVFEALNGPLCFGLAFLASKIKGGVLLLR